MYLFCGRRKAVCKMLGEELGAERWAGGGTTPFRAGSMQNEELRSVSPVLLMLMFKNYSYRAYDVPGAIPRALSLRAQEQFRPLLRRAHGHTGPSFLPSRAGSALPPVFSLQHSCALKS